ncbi:ABC transporter permease [Pseudorhizobium pelagicum]|uniref:ABC transporter permease n=1 Tax=Pseudorhizobium pelagicum TaxID=1509405 RepID=A0A922T8P3_9HYPH|nr:ABC transporter permease [Pseudorhizobium pelagicum]KEQ04036.1 ABC transporter permease [Pseudorhizobium pelagicum]KEQ04922.1 ABC transporter permease [Pseudorhizobium pelagicum]
MSVSPAKLDNGIGASKEAPITRGQAIRIFADERRSFWIVLSLAILFFAWEVAGRIPISFAFPTFSETILAFGEMVADGSMLKAYILTLQPLVLGVIVSAAVGIALGVAMGLSEKAEWLLAPVFIVLQAAPMAALVPLVTFVYGIGLTAKTLAVIMLALPVIVLNSYKAVRHVNPSLVDMCRSFQGNRMQQIFKIIIPDASPVLFAGLRLGIAAGFIGVMLAELLITPTGIGDLITYHRSVANYAHMYAAVASIIAVSTLTLAGLQYVETHLLRPEKRRK